MNNTLWPDYPEISLALLEVSTLFSCAFDICTLQLEVCQVASVSRTCVQVQRASQRMGAYCISANEHDRVLCVCLSGGSEGDCKCVAIEVMCVCRPAALGKKYLPTCRVLYCHALYMRTFYCNLLPQCFIVARQTDKISEVSIDTVHHSRLNKCVQFSNLGLSGFV